MVINTSCFKTQYLWKFLLRKTIVQKYLRKEGNENGTEKKTGLKND